MSDAKKVVMGGLAAARQAAQLLEKAAKKLEEAKLPFAAEQMRSDASRLNSEWERRAYALLDTIASRKEAKKKKQQADKVKAALLTVAKVAATKKPQPSTEGEPTHGNDTQKEKPAAS